MGFLFFIFVEILLKMKKIVLAILLTISSTAFAQSTNINSGPMVGYCDFKEAMIWLQTNKNETVRVDYFATDNPKEIFSSENYSSNKENGFTYHIILDKLQPNKKYTYSVVINNKKIVLPYETRFSSKTLWEWRADAPDFKVAFGSCNYVNEPEVDRPGKPYGSNHKIFESIATKNPDIMLWGGDNVYLREVDFGSKTGIYHRYHHSKSLKEMQPLLAKTQNFALWDDHDFGPNDSDRSYKHKYLTQQAFKDFWANQTYGTNANQQEGVYTTFTWNDAQFFLLDDRFFRSPNDRISGEKTMLGKEQLEWLIDGLSNSNSSFKIIVIGGQVLNSAADKENYGTYPEEKAKLLQEIVTNKIKGVLFLTGDRHFAELSVLNRENTYPIYDWTVSPFTSGVAGSAAKKEPNTLKVEGSTFFEHNFGTLEFSGNKANRQLKLTLFNVDGMELWNKIILKKELE